MLVLSKNGIIQALQEVMSGKPCTQTEIQELTEATVNKRIQVAVGTNEAETLESGKIPFRYFMLDEEIANAAGPMGGGAIAGIGTGPQGEPGRYPSLMPLQRRKKKKRQANVN